MGYVVYKLSRLILFQRNERCVGCYHAIVGLHARRPRIGRRFGNPTGPEGVVGDEHPPGPKPGQRLRRDIGVGVLIYIIENDIEVVGLGLHLPKDGVVRWKEALQV